MNPNGNQVEVEVYEKKPKSILTVRNLVMTGIIILLLVIVVAGALTYHKSIKSDAITKNNPVKKPKIFKPQKIKIKKTETPLDEPETVPLIPSTDEVKTDNPPLIEAIIANDMDLVKSLLANGEDINQRAESIPKMTALMIAIVYRKFDIAKYLIESGADLDLVTTHKTNAMYYAIMKQSTETLRLLIEGGAALYFKPDVHGFMPESLGEMIDYNNLEMIKLIVDNYPEFDLNRKYFLGTTFLGGAVSDKRNEIVQYLIDKKVDLNIIDNSGDNILGIAIICNNFDGAKLLIDAGAEVTESNRSKILNRSEKESRWSTLLEEQSED